MEYDVALYDAIEQAKEALKAGHPAQACRLLTPFRDKVRDDPTFLTLIGASCCMAGCPEKGLPALEQALDIAPSPIAHFNLGEAYQSLGRVHDAAECFKHAIGLDPTYGPALKALAALRDAGELHDDHGATRDAEEDYAGGPHVDSHAHLLTGE